MKTMTKTIRPILMRKFIVCLTALAACLLGQNLLAQQGWDPNGTNSIGGNAVWDTVTKNWTTNGTETQVASGSLVAYTPGNIALFCAGPTGSANQGTFYVTNNTANLSIGSIVNGDDNPGPCTVYIVGTGSLSLPSSLTYVITYNSSLGYTYINVPITGVGPLEAQSSGSLILNAANSFTGGFDIDGSGSVTFGNSAAFGTGSITWVAAGFIQPASGGTAYNITNTMVHLAGIETFSGNSGGVTFSGPWTLPSTGNVTLENILDTITVSGPISGNGGIIINKAGTGWLLTGANTFTNSMAITAGTLTIGGAGQLKGGSYAGNITNAGVLVYNSSASQTLSGVISSTGSLTQAGSGKLVLSGLNTYTGVTTNSGGILEVNSLDTPGTSGPLGALATNSAGSIVLSGGTLQYSSANAHDYSGRFSTAANQAYKIDVNGQSVTFATALTSSGGALTVSDSAGGGTLTLNDDNTYTGATTINSGTVALGTFATPFGAATGTIYLAGGAINATLNRGTTGTENILNPVVITGNSVLKAATTTGTRYLTFGGPFSSTGGSLTIQNTETTNGGAVFQVVLTNAATLNVPVILTNSTAGNLAQLGAWNSSSVGDQVYNGVISGPGSIYRTTGQAAGTGARMILNAANTYSGGTSNNDGEIACGTSSSGPADAPTNGPIGTGTMTVGNANAKISAYGGARVVGNHVLLASSPFTFTGSNSLTMAGNFDFGGLGRTLAVSNIGLTELTGSILNGGLTVSGGGTLTLAGTNAYSGVTTITNSTLALTGNGSINNSSLINILAGSTFDVSALASPYSLSSATTLGAAGIGGGAAAIINGASGGVVNLGAQPLSLVFTPASFTGDTAHPSLYIAQAALTLNGNTITVNNASATPLGAGIYTLVQVAGGTIVGLPNSTVTVTGSGLASGTAASISVSGGSVILTVLDTPSFSNLAPSPSIAYGATSLTLTGTLSAAGPSYPAASETVSATINGRTVAGTVIDGTGDFSITYNDPSLATDSPGTPYVITYIYGGDASLNPATNSATTLTVNPASQTISFGSLASQTYGAAPFAISATASSGLPVSFSVVSGSATLSGNTVTVTGTGTVSIQALQPGSVDYSAATPVTNSFSVSALTVDLSGSRSYDGTNDATNTILTITNIVGADSVTLASGAAALAGSDVGTNAITNIGTLVLGGSSASNYSLTGATGAVVITPLPLALTGSRNYDGTAIADYSILSITNAVGNDDVSLAGGSAALAGETAGTEAITNSTGLVLGGITASNYTVTNATGSITINPVPLTITALSQSIGYGTAVPATTVSYTGFVGGDSSSSLTTPPTVSSAQSGVVAAGTYSGNYTVSGATDPNYVITYVPGDLIVGTANLLISASSQSIIYGMSVPAATVSYSGFVNGDTSASLTTQPSIASAQSGVVPAGSYPGNYTASGAVDSNYNISYAAGNLAVAPLTVVLTGTRNYDGTAVATNSVLVVSNARPGDVVDLASGSAALDSSDIGTNAITNVATLTLGGTAGSNYTLLGAGGAIVITPLPVILTGSRDYDGTAIADYSILSITNAVAGDDVSVTNGSAELAAATAGTEAITDASGLTLGGTTSSNYTLTGAAGSVTIEAVPLTITALPQSIIYGATVPTTTVTYSGFVGGDTLASLTTPPGIASVESGIAPAGIYAANYTASGAVDSNYDISYVAGSLTVSPLTVVLTGARGYDGTDIATNTILSVANVVGSDMVDLASGSATLAGANVGTQAITSLGTLTLGGGSATNYTLVGATGSVVISNAFTPFIITSSSVDSTGTNFTVCWQSVPGVSYTVLTNTTLASPQAWAVAGGPITASNTTTCYTLTGAVIPGTNAFVIIKQ